MQKIYKEFVKQRHTHWFIAGICYKCHLARENLHNPWKVFLKRYGTGSYGEPLRRTKWNRYSQIVLSYCRLDDILLFKIFILLPFPKHYYKTFILILIIRSAKYCDSACLANHHKKQSVGFYPLQLSSFFYFYFYSFILQTKWSDRYKFDITSCNDRCKCNFVYFTYYLVLQPRGLVISIFFYISAIVLVRSSIHQLTIIFYLVLLYQPSSYIYPTLSYEELWT